MSIKRSVESKNGYAGMADIMSHAAKNALFIFTGCEKNYANRSNNAYVWEMLESGSIFKDITS